MKFGIVDKEWYNEYNLADVKHILIDNVGKKTKIIFSKELIPTDGKVKNKEDILREIVL